MQTEWIWAAKANQAILTEKRSQKVWLEQDLLNKSVSMQFCGVPEIFSSRCWRLSFFPHCCC